MTHPLLPCPFCGGDAERIDVPACEHEGGNAGGSCIQCTSCAASTALHFDRKENLYSSWNERATSDLYEALYDLVAVCEKQPRISKSFPDPGSPLGKARSALAKARGEE